MEKISFNEVLDTCLDYMEDPSDKDLAKRLEDLKAKLIVREYLPMQEKVVTLYKITLDADKPLDTNTAFFTVGIELACVFSGLLAYTNIDPNIEQGLKIYESYDLLYTTGIADYILQYCEKDYNRLIKMLDKTISYDNLRELIETIGKMDSKALNSLTHEYKNFKKELDSEVVKNMADIAKFNDPELYKLKTQVIDQVLDNIDKADKLEKIVAKNKKQ